MRTSPLLFALLILGGCASHTVSDSPADPKFDYVIDAQPHISLHRAFNANGRTYLEFLDAKRMNPVVTGVDGVPLSFYWDEQHVVLDGTFDNLTVTTPHGVAHVYAKRPVPPARVTAAAPARALEYGAVVPQVTPPAPDNYGFAELPPVGDGVEPERISVLVSDSFMGSLSDGQASQILGAAREAVHVTIGAQAPKDKKDKKNKKTDREALAHMSDAKQFLIDNGIAEYKIRTARIIQSSKPMQVDFKISY